MTNYKDIPPIKVGDKAPLFTLKNQSGQKVALKDFLGKKNVLLIFYPGDNTPGCTKQLCAVRNDFSKFQKLDTIIFGVNHADDTSHQKFIDKYKFPFDLLIDSDKKVSRKYKALKFMFGHESIKRSVVLIDKQGKIVFLKRGMPSDQEIIDSLKK
ncbi:peroxiredoxin [Candidatus Parcubacteria bacterium]|nr:MAG: peroxiredoxin [Candidatus Parcubacteria bacterium]